MALPIRRTDDTPDMTGDTTGDKGALARWEPLSELEQLNRRLAGYVDLWRGSALLDGHFTPPADVEETDDAYLVDVELPGVGKHDLDTATSTPHRPTYH